MSFRCDAPRDCGCLHWNRGQASEFCLAASCEYLVQSYNIRKCSCGSSTLPALFGEGQARQPIKEKNIAHPIMWNQFMGYVVECPNCLVRTPYCSAPEEAVRLWNGSLNKEV